MGFYQNIFGKLADGTLLYFSANMQLVVNTVEKPATSKAYRDMWRSHK